MDVQAQDSKRLLQGLTSPSAYPHPVGTIRVTETHISWVILTGEFAYKLKKPVKLGFLDFSTLERRREFCEQELRLNRRYSPDLYLDVVPICGTPDAPRIDGEGEPIEYAVRMRQFPDDTLLSRELRANHVTPDHIDALARTIAEFHGRAEIATVASPWGTPEEIWMPVAENFEQLRSAGIDASQVRPLFDWSQDAFERLQSVFNARRAGGFVRECHGDLHTNNILLLDGRPRLFDCVEFNDSFRWVDVLSDLAFLCMDLADFGRDDFAHRLLDTYLGITGDYAGLATWRFYLVYRALVRAKVAAIRQQQAVDDRERAEAAKTVAMYLKLASRDTRPGLAKLMITHGPSGSGKSTLTQPLIEALGAIRIRSDVERRHLDDGRNHSERYSATGRRRVYEQMAQHAQSALKDGFSVIVDATFLSRSDRTLFQLLAEAESVEFLILDFQTPVEQLRDRIVRRQAAGMDASEADTAVLESQLQAAEPLDADEREAAIRIDTTQTDAAAELASRVGGNGGMWKCPNVE